MSTKTTFKRVALVAVAALGLSLVAVTPSTAANSADVMTLGATASNGTTGTAAKTTVSFTGITDGTFVGMTATAVLLSAPATSSSAGILPAFSYTADQVTANTTGKSVASGTSNVMTITPTAAGRFTGTGTLTVTPDVAGTYVYRITPAGGFTTTAQTWTLTVAAKATISATSSTVHMGYDYYQDAVNTAIRGAWAAPDATTDAAGVSCYAGVLFSCARIKVVQSNGSTTSPMVAADSVKLTVTTTGPAFVSVDGEGQGYTNQPFSVFAAEVDGVNAATGLTKYVYVKSNGAPGVATVTIKAGDVVLATKTLTFFGNVASLTVTQTAKSIVDTAAATRVATVTAKDESGFNVPVLAADFTVSSATELTAQSVTGADAVDVAATATTARNVSLQLDPTATKTGAKTLTVTHTGSKAATTFGTTVALAAATTVAVTNDQASPVPGQKITYTVTAKDAGGNALPDGTTTVAVTTTLSQSATLPTSVKLSGGVGTFDLFAPVTPGTQTVTVTMDSKSGSTSSDVVDPNAAAVDAAAEAIDAANAATDAANAAAEAADAATAAAQDAADAVAALSVQVSEQIAELKAQNDALRKQLISLTNLIIKIQKKVKA